MPKVGRVGKFRSKAASSRNDVIQKSLSSTVPSKENEAETADLDRKELLSRGQKKRQAKREQYLKREKMVMSSLRLKRLEDQKGELDGMDSIKDALSTVSNKPLKNKGKEERINPDEKKTTAPIAKTNRSKQDLTSKEVSHLGLVLQHPAFKSNPFGTIQEHLKNTLSGQAEELEVLAEKKRKQNDVKKADRKEARKERLREAKYQQAKRAGKKGRK
uniref:Uncharacterized protein n=1 Tax=Eucampia antarctica TaxID=49252 RepID=A0A7S2W8F8_9STRA|mmetsp:Transcript_23729/g.22761  ORF Transcript_23729/g.22761 Transcript_23729/m.22761 type:complete len:217 (+) Transcript_23729:24-674(+)|eukprot:CAMPEP_0197831870 /NCGR_PEP_ID=MMETSP1437-20131217/12528_1 /TAXON_ID=49252 ORGANISM="Eucampia antarctica, Strain CCMP1452" /NCGR_SAMPLE_ID=MMETSP1437 /ASSEMBLY_ACC=CAM_ASM_001096 /LENGTH=216 /DNA_ID=CAMNT_0043434979 /DNA_START=21 /DNA_END=671 /DNA_ORIENTATION=+